MSQKVLTRVVVRIGTLKCYSLRSVGEATLLQGFSPTRRYGARERETLVVSGHVVPEQN